jgi:type IV secretory pathway VirB9-like protein
MSLAVPISAHALSEPSPSPRDEHVRTVAYDPANRIHLTLQQGSVTNITFGPMEMIDHVVKADTAPFDYPAHKDDNSGEFLNNLPLIGKTPGSGTLVVITRGAPPNDRERAYNFAIRTVAAPFAGVDDAAATFQLTISYTAQDRIAGPAAPVDSTAPKVMSWKEKKAAADAELQAARLRSDVGYGPQNTSYLAQGTAKSLAPVTAIDNGALTAFRYPVNMAQPAVFKVLDGHEGLPAPCGGQKAATAELEASEEAVNTRVVNDMLVIDHTAPHWRLRSGEAVIDVFNCGWNPLGTSPGTGTQSPDVVRRIVAR